MHEWVDHTSEVELHVRAATPAEVLAEATAALGELLGEADGPPVERRLAVEAGDEAGRLAAWLEELVFLAESEELIAQGMSDVEVRPGGMSGVVVLAPGRAARLVKAVTYHGLRFSEATDGGWEARVVLDV